MATLNHPHMLLVIIPFSAAKISFSMVKPTVVVGQNQIFNVQMGMSDGIIPNDSFKFPRYGGFLSHGATPKSS